MVRATVATLTTLQVVARSAGAAREDANVVIADVLEQEGRTLADKLGDQAIFSRLDVTSDRDWAATVAGAEDSRH